MRTQDYRQNNDWLGHDQDGRLVSAGVYTIAVDAIDSNGNEARFERNLQVSAERLAPSFSQVRTTRSRSRPSEAEAVRDLVGRTGRGCEARREELHDPGPIPPPRVT